MRARLNSVRLLVLDDPVPWRQMTYKFLNTIIDDLFAFVIKMPLM
jgi:hypothetical protein